MCFVGRLPRLGLLALVEVSYCDFDFSPSLMHFEKLAGGALHCLLQLDVRLGLGQNLAYPSDVMLQ